MNRYQIVPVIIMLLPNLPNHCVWRAISYYVLPIIPTLDKSIR